MSDKKRIIIALFLVLLIAYLSFLLNYDKTNNKTNNADEYAKKLVKASVTYNKIQHFDFDIADLKGGKAVLLNNYAAYFVKDGKVYGVNGIARGWSKNVPSGGHIFHIGYFEVKNAVNK